MILRAYILTFLIAINSIVCLAQDKFALFVGISNYHAIDSNNEWNDIHGVNDVNILFPIFKTQGFQVVSLTDENATKKQIIKELHALEDKVTKGSIVYIHFSAHGQPFQDFDGDEEDGWDESIVPVDAKIEFVKGVYEGENHITDDELLVYTNKLRKRMGPEGCLYVVVDACHAGRTSRGGVRLENTIRGTKRGFSRDDSLYVAIKDAKTLYKINEVPNWAPITFLEACKNTQVNSEFLKDGFYYGPMSYYISVVLKDVTINNDISWVFNVKEMMKSDISLRRQNMVIETSKLEENGK